MPACQCTDNYDIVLHVGAPKTGSSAIQLFLLDNRHALEKNGFYYPDHGKDANGVSGGQSFLGRALLDGNFNDAEKYLKQSIEKARNLDKCLLISAESLYSQSQEICNLVASKRVKIVLFYREPLESMYSSYNQIVKRHLYNGTFQEYCESILVGKATEFTYSEINNWSERFGKENVCVLGYDDSVFKDKSIEKVFLAALGLASSNFEDFEFIGKRVNSGYTRSALELKRLLNTVLTSDDSDLDKTIDVCLQEYSDKNPVNDRSSGISEITSKTRLGLVEKFRESKNYIRNNLMTTHAEGFLQSSSEKFMRDQENETLNPGYRVSLAFAAASAFNKNTELVSLLRARIENNLENNPRSFRLLFLAHIFGIDVFERKESLKKVELKTRVDIMVSEKSGLPDVLREAAVILEQMNEIDMALKLIDRAALLRPEGPYIRKMQDRLKLSIERGDN
ncbi:tetratricopeptide repeat domain protein [marine gamma proteobacterium HTCC2148]|nr:tetratricopeptide repeat domain protein [marine gamma proteobacterium HTCC2148]